MSEQDENEQQAMLPFENGNRVIRRQWVDDRWYFSVVDVIAALTDSPNPRNYWNMLKRKLGEEGFTELYRRCVQLKMRSLDGKRYATDAADMETLLRIVQSIPSPRVEPIKQWLAETAAERLDEQQPQQDQSDPHQSDMLADLTPDQRVIFLRGYMADLNISLAEAAAAVGVLTKRDFAVFNDHGYRGLYGGENAKDIAIRKDLPKGEQILDWMGQGQ